VNILKPTFLAKPPSSSNCGGAYAHVACIPTSHHHITQATSIDVPQTHLLPSIFTRKRALLAHLNPLRSLIITTPPQNHYHPSLSTEPPNLTMPPSYISHLVVVSHLQKMIHDLTMSLTDSNARLHDTTRGFDDLRTSLTDSDARLHAATTELYAQTPFRGIYVSLYPSCFSGEIQVQIKLPGETQSQVMWST